MHCDSLHDGPCAALVRTAILKLKFKDGTPHPPFFCKNIIRWELPILIAQECDSKWLSSAVVVRQRALSEGKRKSRTYGGKIRWIADEHARG